MKRRIPDFTVDELDAFGRDGLLDAASRFEPERGIKFMTFASKRIRGAILDGTRNFRPGKRARKELGNPAPFSIDAIDTHPPDRNHGPHEVAEIKDLAENCLSYLNVRTQKIVRLRVYNGLTFPDIASRVKLTTTHVHMLFHRAMTILRRHHA